MERCDTPSMTQFGVAAESYSLQDIPWLPANDNGTKSATLVGTRDPGVMFTYAFFIPAGVWDEPHSHGADVHLIVASGELQLAYRESFDAHSVMRFAAGSFLYVPSHSIHFDGAYEDTIVIGTSVGPGSTDYA